MKFVGLLLLLCFAVGGSMNATPMNNDEKERPRGSCCRDV